MQKLAIVDIETNGPANRITEIAVIVYDGRQVVDEFQSLVNPGGRIPAFITALTGITEEMLTDAPAFDQIAGKVDDITRDCIFVAHSVNFDYNIIKAEFQNFGMQFQRTKMCTVRLARKILPGRKSYSLGNICGELNININGRHRAYGDAAATKELIQHLQTHSQFDEAMRTLLHVRSQEATIPSHLDRTEFDRLPGTEGIYLFYNARHQLIYTGKAKNIRKRVLSHFYSKSRYKSTMLREIAHVDFKTSGSELMALLMEDAVIKRNFPKYNKASKVKITGFALVSYYNRRGILSLGIQEMKKAIEPHRIFYSQQESRNYLEKLAGEFNLCPKYCQLLGTAGDCSASVYFCCEGICCNLETTEAYNAKVISALENCSNDLPDGIIRLKGRTPNEVSFIRIKNGKYCGYGFVDHSTDINHYNLDDFLIKEYDNPNVRQILKKVIHLIEEIPQYQEN